MVKKALVSPALLSLALSLLVGGVGGQLAGAATASAKTEITTGKAQLAKGQFVPAIASLDKAVKLDPKNAEAFMLLGEANLKAKRYGAAKTALVTAIKLSHQPPFNKAICIRANDDLLKLPKNLLTINSINALACHPDLFAPARSRGLETSPTVGLPKPKVIDFYADWCGPCKALKPVLEKTKKKYEDKVEFVALNADDEETQKLMEKYGVSALPTLVFLAPDGEMVTYSVGFSGEENITWSIKTLLQSSKEHTAVKKSGG
jgi:thioredoxin 1